MSAIRGQLRRNKVVRLHDTLKTWLATIERHNDGAVLVEPIVGDGDDLYRLVDVRMQGSAIELKYRTSRDEFGLTINPDMDDQIRQTGAASYHFTADGEPGAINFVEPRVLKGSVANATALTINDLVHAGAGFVMNENHCTPRPDDDGDQAWLDMLENRRHWIGKTVFLPEEALYDGNVVGSHDHPWYEELGPDTALGKALSAHPDLIIVPGNEVNDDDLLNAINHEATKHTNGGELLCSSPESLSFVFQDLSQPKDWISVVRVRATEDRTGATWDMQFVLEYVLVNPAHANRYFGRTTAGLTGLLLGEFVGLRAKKNEQALPNYARINIQPIAISQKSSPDYLTDAFEHGLDFYIAMLPDELEWLEVFEGVDESNIPEVVILPLKKRRTG